MKEIIVKIKPLKTKVALKEVKKESVSSSGIVLMSDVSGETPEFSVIAVGPQVESVVVGDKVIIQVGKATAVGDSMLVIEEEFISAVLDND
jgi:co-chaperonin GroES (HSP10)